MVHGYDFGDDWRHRISVEAREKAERGRLYPRLENATGRSPPEDVGELPGYAGFLEAIADSQHPDHAATLRWHSGPFDPQVRVLYNLHFKVLKQARRRRPK